MIRAEDLPVGTSLLADYSKQVFTNPLGILTKTADNCWKWTVNSAMFRYYDDEQVNFYFLNLDEDSWLVPEMFKITKM